jgi:Leucine-rich repeat (LRR) protein
MNPAILLGLITLGAGQQDAFDMLQQAGAEITRDTEGRVVALKLEHRPIGDEEMAAVAEFPDLRRLYLARTRVTDAGLAHLAGLRLERLSLWHTKITDAGLPVLGRLSSLRALDIHGNPITDDGLAHLSNLNRLQLLNLRQTRVTGTGAKHLEPLRSLRYLELSHAPLTEQGTRQLLSLIHRTRMDLRDTPIRLAWIPDATAENVVGLVLNQHDTEPRHHSTDQRLVLTGIRADDLPPLERFNHGRPLRWLHISGDCVTDETLPDLRKFPALDTLNLQNTRVTDATARRLAGMPNLTSIDFGGTSVTAAALDVLAALAGLEELAIDNTKLHGEQLGQLRRLANLKRLTVGGRSFGAEGFEALAALPQVYGLTIRDPEFPPGELRSLSKMTGLRHLALAGPQIDDQWLPALENLAGIDRIDLQKTGVSEQALALLKNLGGLRAIRLPGLDVEIPQAYRDVGDRADIRLHLTFRRPWQGGGAEGLAAFQHFWLQRADDLSLAAFRNLPQTRSLSIFAGDVSAAGFADLTGLGQLERLHVQSRSLDDRVVPYLNELSNLRHINLFETNVGAASIELFRHLPHLNHLTTSTHHVHIEPVDSPDGVKVTASLSGWRLPRDGDFQPLTSIPNVRVLHLRQHFVPVPRVDALLDVVARIDGLKRLELFRWELTQEGSAHFSRMASLEELSLSETKLEGEDLPHLGKLPKLRLIEAPGSDVGAAGLAPLAGATALEVIDGLKVGPRGTAGLERLERLRALRLPGSDLADEGLSHLTSLRRLEELDISGSQVTDAGLSHLSQIQSLRILNLADTPVEGSGLAHLQSLDNLQALYLVGTKVADRHLAHLQELRSLRELTLPQIRGEGLQDLAALGLKRLELRGPLTGDALQHLLRIESLETLVLRGEIPRHGLAALARLENLRDLTVGTDVSDEQMQQLAEVTSLRRLTLGGSGRRDAGPRALAKLPHLEYLHLGFMTLTGEAWQALKDVIVTTYD